VASTPPGASAEQPVCLIADDDEAIRSLLVAILESAGLRCVVAPNRATAEERLRTEAVDVALLDLSVLEGDHLAFIRDLRAAAPTTAVVVVSGHRDAAMMRDLLEAGAAAYVHKPFSAAQLRETVLAALADRA
jgi:DNA-binding NtrC family response regulator